MKIEQQNSDIACALATCVAAPIYFGASSICAVSHQKPDYYRWL